MDKQQIFDTVATHLLDQGKPALDAEGFCRYRTESGLMCAVGCLIPDEKYTPKIEGIPVGNIPHALPFPTDPELLDFLTDLQGYHDSDLRSGLNLWKTAMRALARRHGLNAEVLAN